jgi:hypothetical protein
VSSSAEYHSNKNTISAIGGEKNVKAMTTDEQEQ